MRKRLNILGSLILATIILSLTLVFFKHKYEEAQNSGVTFIFSKEDYLFSFIAVTIFIIIPTFLLGLIFWFVFKKKQPHKLLYFICLSSIGISILAFKNVKVIYETWHYKKHQANIDYNESLTKRNGNYLDSCMLLVQQDIQKTGLSANDYRVSYYSYDNELSTIPRDTTKKYYSYELFYYLTNCDKKVLRAASYLINFQGRLKKLYDIDANDEKAKQQVEALKSNFKKLKTTLEELPDSATKDFEELKNKLKKIK